MSATHVVLDSPASASASRSARRQATAMAELILQSPANTIDRKRRSVRSKHTREVQDRLAKLSLDTELVDSANSVEQPAGVHATTGPQNKVQLQPHGTVDPSVGPTKLGSIDETCLEPRYVGDIKDNATAGGGANTSGANDAAVATETAPTSPSDMVSPRDAGCNPTVIPSVPSQHTASAGGPASPQDIARQRREAEQYAEMCNLFVGDLSRSATEEDVLRVFREIGKVSVVDIKRDKITGNNLGYGFVQYKTRELAEEAKRELDGREICGRPIRLGWAQKNTTLFITDIDVAVTSERLREEFRVHGPLYDDETFVKPSEADSTVTVGYVRYRWRPDAENAKQAMNRKRIGQYSIRIGWGDNALQKHCVHVSFDPNLHSGPYGVHEDMFRPVFEELGPIASISIPRHPQTNATKGYVFVNFVESHAGERAAALAIANLSGTVLPTGMLVRCSYGKKQPFKSPRAPHRGVQYGNGAYGSGSWGYAPQPYHQRTPHHYVGGPYHPPSHYNRGQGRYNQHHHNYQHRGHGNHNGYHNGHHNGHHNGYHNGYNNGGYHNGHGNGYHNGYNKGQHYNGNRGQSHHNHHAQRHHNGHQNHRNDYQRQQQQYQQAHPNQAQAPQWHGHRPPTHKGSHKGGSKDYQQAHVHSTANLQHAPNAYVGWTPFTGSVTPPIPSPVASPANSFRVMSPVNGPHAPPYLYTSSLPSPQHATRSMVSTLHDAHSFTYPQQSPVMFPSKHLARPARPTSRHITSARVSPSYSPGMPPRRQPEPQTSAPHIPPPKATVLAPGRPSSGTSSPQS